MNATAAIFDGPNRPLRLEPIPLPTLRPGEALVRVRLCTLCGSDLHTFLGHRTEPTPTILGHEIVGVVQEIHPDSPMTDVHAEPLRVGDRVVWSVAVSCGSCFFCRKDLPQKCVTVTKYGHLALRDGAGLHGGLATHCHLLRGTAVVKVPDDLPDAIAAPAMCATATVMAALRVGGEFLPGDVVLIFGLGLLGLTSCAVASSKAATVIAVDPNESRHALAKTFGAAEVGAAGSNGADLAFEFSGATSAAALGVRSTRIGGTIVLVGSVSPGEPLALNLDQVVRKCLTIRGIHNYAPHDLVAALEWLRYQHSNFPFSQVVSRIFPLSHVEEAFEYASREKPIRVAVRPE